MFSFLNTILLFALPAALLPLIIHLFTRRKLRLIPFSSLSFLKVLQRQRMRQLKLYRWLLLVIRTLIVLLLVLTFARPALRGIFSAGLGVRARSTVVILLDNSGSMGGDTRDGILIKRAKERVYRVLDLLDAEDQAHLVVYNDDIGFINEEPTDNRAWLQDIVDKTALSTRGTDHAAAFRTAARLLSRSSDINREVYYVSDGCGGNGSDSVSFPGEGVTVFKVGPENDGIENAAVLSVSPANQIFAVSRPLRINATIGNYGSGAPVTLPVRLYMQGERVNETVVTVAAGQTKTSVLHFLPERPGHYGGYVEIGDDALRADNRRHFVLNIPDRIRVLIVHNDTDDGSGASRFIQYALEPREGAAAIRPRRIRQSDMARVSLDDYDAVILADAGTFTGVQEQQLIRFSKRGGGVLVFPGSATDIRSMNRVLGNAGGIRLLRPEGSPGQTGAFFRFKNIDYSHPVFNGLVSRNDGFESPHIYARYRLGVPETGGRVVSFGDGGTALAEHCGNGHGPVFVFAFNISPDWSNFAVRAGFVPVLYRLVQYSASGAVAGTYRCNTGEPYTGVFPGLPGGGGVTVRAPDGQIYTVATGAGDGMFAFNETGEPGIYRILHEGTEYGRFAVTLPPQEADLRPAGKGRLRALTGNARIINAGADTDIAAVVRNARYGREVYGEAVWLIVILLTVEMMAVLAGRRSSAAGRKRDAALRGSV